MLARLVTFLLFQLLVIHSSNATVILLYHHVSTTTPTITSVSAEQFETQLQYLADEQFTVLPLPKVIGLLKNKQPLPDKSVVITFDDAYANNVTQAKPILDKFNYPYTIFVNPKSVQSNSRLYLTWEQLGLLAKSSSNQVTIANHGFTHDSFIRPKEGIPEDIWFKEQTDNLLLTEDLIEKYTGQKWRFFAYPYGEYSPKIQQWLHEHDFVAFTQQSGAVGQSADLTIIPRFPASQPYHTIEGLKNKLYSLPLSITLTNNEYHNTSQTIFEYNAMPSATFKVKVKDFYRGALTCYVSNLGKQELVWANKTEFTLNFEHPIAVGRVRSNCTAASISKPGRYYWFSQAWFVRNEDKSWYPVQ